MFKLFTCLPKIEILTIVTSENSHSFSSMISFSVKYLIFLSNSFISSSSANPCIPSTFGGITEDDVKWLNKNFLFFPT